VQAGDGKTVVRSTVVRGRRRGTAWDRRVAGRGEGNVGQRGEEEREWYGR
jgi:hypothetical protein